MQKKVTGLIFILMLSLSTVKAQTFTLQDTTFEVGDVLIRDIYFDFDALGILPESFPFLDSLAAFMKENSNLSMEIGTHTDYRGAASYNLKLTEMRSKAIADYLERKEVDKERLSAVGYGETKPLIPNEEIEKMEEKQDREIALAKNRRTEFKILSVDYRANIEESVEPNYPLGYRQDMQEDSGTMDKEAEFPGGKQALGKYIIEHLTIESGDVEENINSRLYVQFTVTKTGALTDIHILKGVSQKIDEKVLKIFREMPDWTPGTSNGKPVAEIVTYPINISWR